MIYLVSVIQTFASSELFVYAETFVKVSVSPC